MAVRLPITTAMGHVSRAILFQELEFIYLGLGRTSPWPGETSSGSTSDFSAPAPSVSTTQLDELIGLKRVDIKSLVYPSDSGTIQYRDQLWKRVSKSEALSLGAHWVYLEASLNYEEFPEASYRQIGIFTMVEVSAGIDQSATPVLLPGNIVSTGILEVLDNRKVTTRSTDTKDTFSMIIEF